MKALVIFLCILALPAAGIFVIGSGGGSAGSLQPAANLIQERFEAPGFTGTNNWVTNVGGGTVNAAYNTVASNILAGSYSMLLVASAQTVNGNVAFAGQTNAVGYQLFKRLSANSNYRLFAGLGTNRSTVVYQVVLDNNQKLTIRAGSGTAIVGSNAVPQGPIVQLRWSYTAGSGANAFASVEWSTNGSFNGYQTGTNGNYVRDTVGNATALIGAVRLGADNATGFNNVWDNVYVSTATNNDDFSNLHP